MNGLSVPGLHRMKVRFGDHAFMVSGREDVVKEQYDRFVEAAVAIAQASAGPAKSPAKSSKSANGHDVESGVDSMDSALVDAKWDRVFKRKDDQVSLIVLPSTKTQVSDALILILYGFQTLLKAESVSCVDMMAAAKVSGVRIGRIDRALPAAYGCYYHKGGFAKGTRYTLNNQGLRYAQELLEEMFEA